MLLILRVAEFGRRPPEPSFSVRSNQVNPNADTSANAPASGTVPARPVIIYLKDGTSFSPSDYWLADEQLQALLAGLQAQVLREEVVHYIIDRFEKELER